ncbi:MAG: hypothetical protein JNJ85_04080, partial [Candidatus Kapabacteria bacterium]|nr:hypothetical protein [Candidatus Kapabacteria bacterium]
MFTLYTLLPLTAQTWQKTNGPSGGNFTPYSQKRGFFYHEVAGPIILGGTNTNYYPYYAPYERYLDTTDVDQIIENFTCTYGDLTGGYNTTFLVKGKLLVGKADTASVKLKSPAKYDIPAYAKVDSEYIRKVYLGSTWGNSTYDKPVYITNTGIFMTAGSCSKKHWFHTEKLPRAKDGGLHVKEITAYINRTFILCLDSAGTDVWYYGYRDGSMNITDVYPDKQNMMAVTWTSLTNNKNFTTPI